MKSWRILPGEQRELFSPVGLRLLDRMTGLAPIGRVTPLLEIHESPDVWRKIRVKALFSLSGVITYPGLERRAEVVGQPPRHYRIVLDCEFYRPLYRLNSSGFEFDAYPYNDTNPPNVIASQIQEISLMPASNYPFPAHIAVLRGAVVDQNGSKITDATVSEGTREKALTDTRGEFALPLRWVQKNISIPINASDHSTGKAGVISITIPEDLGKNHNIVIL